MREWVRSGFADPQTGWNDNSEAQYRLARRTCGFAARNFLANGNSRILDDAVFPTARSSAWAAGAARGPGLPPVSSCRAWTSSWSATRNAPASAASATRIGRIHGRIAGWYGCGLPIIDNSQPNIPETARILDDVLARSIASPPAW
ncbi:ATP-binding protein OS=Streptomyces griseomycini OX=66895 GN=FHS37_004658 PE=4 SV=1 [Streptomyces griseomycini]